MEQSKLKKTVRSWDWTIITRRDGQSNSWAKLMSTNLANYVDSFLEVSWNSAPNRPNFDTDVFPYAVKSRHLEAEALVFKHQYFGVSNRKDDVECCGDSPTPKKQRRNAKWST